MLQHIPGGGGSPGGAGAGGGAAGGGLAPSQTSLWLCGPGNVARALVHPVPGVANIHVPLDALVWPTLIHIQGLPRTPVIWAVAAWTPGTVACLGGTRAHAGQAQTAERQRSCCKPDDHSLHKPRIMLHTCFVYRKCRKTDDGTKVIVAGVLTKESL